MRGCGVTIKREFRVRGYEAQADDAPKIVEQLSKSRDADVGKCVVRIRADTRRGAKNIARNSIVKISRVDKPKSKSYAVLRALQILAADEIIVDYETSQRLDLSSKKSVELKIEPLRWYQYGNYFRNHPDPVIKYADRISNQRFWAGLFAGVIIGYFVGFFNPLAGLLT